MARENKGLRETLLQAGGVVVTSISTAGLVIAGVLTFIGGQPDGETTRAVAQTEARAATCDAFLEYLADDTPREPASAAERRAIERMTVQNARECTIYDDGLPLPPTLQRSE